MRRLADIIGAPFLEDNPEDKKGNFENEDDKVDAKNHANSWAELQFLQEEIKHMEKSHEPPFTSYGFLTLYFFKLPWLFWQIKNDFSNASGHLIAHW